MTSPDKLFDLVTEVRDSTVRTEQHLRELNHKTAKHEKQIDELRTNDTALMMQMGPIVRYFDKEEERAEKRAQFWWERGLWALGILAIAVLSATGIINLDRFL